MNSIGKKIKVLRLSRQMPQKQVAAALGISVAAYSKNETGMTDCSISRLMEICVIFEVSAASLFQDTSETNKTREKELLGLLEDANGKISILREKLIGSMEENIRLRELISNGNLK